MKTAALLLAGPLAAVTGPASAQAQPPKAQRLALVIGNGAYRDSALPNPVNDAADMAKVLEASGLFYFAGHGMQVRGRNYLLPVDADIAREDEVAFNALDLGAVMEKLDSAKNPVNIVVLDACRDDPFGSRLHASAKGLAPIDAPPGTLIAYATAPGSTAADGAGRNGLYTHHLVRQIERPGLAIEEVFKAVRAGVRADSKNLQVPWESTSLESAFAFRQKPPEKVAVAPPSAPAGKSAPRAKAPPVAAAPAFLIGDNWTYRVVNQIDQSERLAFYRVNEIRGEEVRYANGNVGDLMGNYTRVERQGGRVEIYKPTNYFYVFPLKAGADWEAKVEQAVGKRISDLAVRMKVIGEEDLETPLGKVRAMKIERESRWRERDNRGSGTRKWTYWYNAGIKRFVRAEDLNTTTEGKVLAHERWELVAYDVK